MKMFFLISLLVALSFLSLFVGAKEIALSDIFQPNNENALIMTISRIPRTAAVVLAGIGISVSGLIMQQITQNKFVSPTTAGTLDSAKMGLLMSFLLLPQGGAFNKMLFAFVFTFLSSVIFLKIADKIRYRNIIFIPLVGLMFGGILNSISTFFAYKYNIVQNVNSWLIGDFSSILQGRYEVIYLSIPAVALTYLYANQFTVVGMGPSFSKNLGLSYRTITNIGLFCISLTVSVVAISVGIIPFLGLIVPNIVSIFFGDNLRKTLPITALLGAIFLVLCDIVGRLIIFPFEVPIGMVVGVIGGTVFLILLIRKK